MTTVAAAEVSRYLTGVKTVVSSKGQIVLPAELREQDGIVAGQQFDVERLDEGRYLLTRRALHNVGLVDWLLECPTKGWFTAIDSGSTDDL